MTIRHPLPSLGPLAGRSITNPLQHRRKLWLNYNLKLLIPTVIFITSITEIYSVAAARWPPKTRMVPGYAWSRQVLTRPRHPPSACHWSAMDYNHSWFSKTCKTYIFGLFLPIICQIWQTVAEEHLNSCTDDSPACGSNQGYVVDGFWRSEEGIRAKPSFIIGQSEGWHSRHNHL